MQSKSKKSNFFKMGLTALALASSAASFAQPVPNPMDVVPEKMPNDIPYGAPMSLDRASQVLDAALAESKRRNWKLICAVVDPSGFLITISWPNTRRLVTRQQATGSNLGIQLGRCHCRCSK